MSQVREWYYKMPFFTNYWLTLSIVFNLFVKLEFVTYTHFILDIRPFIDNYQIWRPVTALFYYPLNMSTTFHFLVNCFFLYVYSERLESGAFRGKSSDYLCLLIFNWICCVVIGFFTNFPFIMDPMVMSVVVVWCQVNPYSEVSSIFHFKNKYLPWVLMIFHLIINGGGIMEFLGIPVGHVAYFLAFDWPKKYKGPALLAPPTFLKRWLSEEAAAGVFEPALQPPRRGHLWGQGHPLANKH